MKGNELLDKMELIDPAYVEAAEVKPARKKRVWLKWGAAAACLCILAGAAALVSQFRGNQMDPQPGALALSDQTTAKVSYGCEAGTATAAKADLQYLTEEELFAQENMYAFRGRVSGLSNITIDFNGVEEVRCIATLAVEEVYQGDIFAGEAITMLLPCAIDSGNVWVEDTDVISRLESGMEGIFMARMYNDESRWEQNGAKLMLKDVAVCGLMDGMRWVFLSTDQGLLFERSAYPGAKNAETLDDIEAYVIEMLK